VTSTNGPSKTKQTSPSELSKSSPGKKLSFKEQKELENLPKMIESLEAQQAEMHLRMADPSFFKGSPQEIASMNTKLSTIQAELASLFARWEALEARA
jgi:ATP-binding cassette subfamily F protein uup